MTRFTVYIIHYKLINFVSQMTDSNKESQHISHPSPIVDFLFGKYISDECQRE